MRFKLLSFCFTWLFVASLASGCSSTTQYYPVNSARSVYVTSMPPAQKKEVVSARPSQVHIWVKGSWHWNQGDETWVWKKGNWKKPPKKGYVWKTANCEKRCDQVIVYTQGYWILEKKPGNHPSQKKADNKVKADNHPSQKKAKAGKTVNKAEPAVPADPKKGTKAEPAKPAKKAESKKSKKAETKKGNKAEPAKPDEPGKPATAKKNKADK